MAMNRARVHWYGDDGNRLYNGCLQDAIADVRQLGRLFGEERRRSPPGVTLPSPSHVTVHTVWIKVETEEHPVLGLVLLSREARSLFVCMHGQKKSDLLASENLLPMTSNEWKEYQNATTSAIRTRMGNVLPYIPMVSYCKRVLEG